MILFFLGERILFSFILVKIKVCLKSYRVSHRFLANRLGTTQRPTKRAPNAGDSARFSSSFLASSFFCFRVESHPTHTRLTPAVSLQKHVIH
jgi:hypothetical protein